MGMLTTFVNQLTAPYRDFKFAFMKIKTLLLQPFRRLLTMQKGIAGDVRNIGGSAKLPPGPKL